MKGVPGRHVPDVGAELYDTIREACRLARSGAPGPVFVEVPVNLYLFTHEVELGEPANDVATPVRSARVPRRP